MADTESIALPSKTCSNCGLFALKYPGGNRFYEASPESRQSGAKGRRMGSTMTGHHAHCMRAYVTFEGDPPPDYKATSEQLRECMTASREGCPYWTPYLGGLDPAKALELSLQEDIHRRINEAGRKLTHDLEQALERDRQAFFVNLAKSVQSQEDRRAQEAQVWEGKRAKEIQGITDKQNSIANTLSRRGLWLALAALVVATVAVIVSVTPDSILGQFVAPQ